MHEETLAKKTKVLFDKLTKEKWLKSFYLAGGTALALHYGHRESVDLDWFTIKNIRTKDLLSKLSKIGKFVSTTVKQEFYDFARRRKYY